MTGEITEADLELAASIMQRIQGLVSELPKHDFIPAKTRMVTVYNAIER